MSNFLVWLISKGADSVIVPLLKQGGSIAKELNEPRDYLEVKSGWDSDNEQLSPTRLSLTVRKSCNLQRISTSSNRANISKTAQSFEIIRSSLAGNRRPPFLPSKTDSSLPSLATDSPRLISPKESIFTSIDGIPKGDDSTAFNRCLNQVDEFATEGLRTLLFGQKYISSHEYTAWKNIYQSATTSLTNRQVRIEAAGELIEGSLNLLGASAIEDKLQSGVPQTIDQLRRANIKIWMLTGDKRETAINIAHSARICLPASEIFVLDYSRGDLEGQMSAALEEIANGCSHSVAVIDGQTLAEVESNSALKALFYSLIPCIDSVICCRASPAQKSGIVNAIRIHIPSALTLAIGDGANDIAMIQASVSSPLPTLQSPYSS